MIKLVVSDLDGTLLPYGCEKLNSDVLERINAILSDGKFFAVSSGRIYSELKYYLSAISDKVYIVSSDGALLTYGDKIIFHKPFSYDALSYSVSSSNKTVLRFFAKDRVYSFNDKENRFPQDIKILKPFEIKDSVYKIISYGAPILNFEGIYSRIHYSDGILSEYVPPYADKGIALGALQRHLGVSIYDTLAMGDSVNDIPMMKNAKYSVTVGNASQKLSSKCAICSDSAEVVLEKVWLNSDFDI